MRYSAFRYCIFRWYALSALFWVGITILLPEEIMHAQVSPESIHKRISSLRENGNALFLSRTLTKENGLPSNTVYAVCRTSTGLLWIATVEGLCTYDGVRVRRVEPPTQTGRSQHLVISPVYALAEDSTGVMWLGTRNGLLRYDTRRNLWSQILPSQKFNKEYSFVSTLLTDHRGTLWIGTRAGLLRYDAFQQQCTEGHSSLRGKDVFHLHEDQHKRLWIGAWGEEPLSADSTRTHWKQHPFTAAFTQRSDILYFHESHDDTGIIVSATTKDNNALFFPVRLGSIKSKSRLRETSPSTPHSLSGAAIRKILAQQEVDMEVWASGTDQPTWLSLTGYGSALGNVRQGLYYLPNSTHALPAEPLVRGQIMAFARAPNGMVIVGTKQSGCTILFPTGAQQLARLEDYGRVYALKSDRMGTLWLATTQGLFYQQDATTLSNTRWQRVGAGASPAILPTTTSVYDVQETPDGRILAATDAGLMLVQRETANNTSQESKRIAWTPLTGFVRSVGRVLVRRLVVQPFDSTIFCDVPRLGLVRCSSKDGTLIQVWRARTVNDPDTAEALGHSRIFHLSTDPEGNVWIGTLMGVDRWNRSTGHVEPCPIISSGKSTSTTTSNALQTVSVCAHTASTTYAVLYGVGIAEFKRDTKTGTVRFSQMMGSSSSSGWSNLQLQGVQMIDSVLWWCTFDHAIGTFNPRSGLVQEFLPSTREAPANARGEGSDGAEFSNGGMMQLVSNNALAFEYNGDVLVAPIFQHPTNGNGIGNGLRRVMNMDTAQVLALAWYENDSLRGGMLRTGDTLHCSMNASLTLDCAILSFRHGERHRLRYRLEGLEAAWSLAPAKDVRLIRYSALPHGEYRLHIESIADDGTPEGLQSSSSLVLTLIIPTPWYRLWAVQGSSALLILLGVVMLTRHMVNRRAEQGILREQEAREKAQLERLLMEFQLKTLRLQMDPHFMFNALMLLQELTLLDTEQAIEYIAVFADLLRKILLQSNHHTIRVVEEISLLERYMRLEQMRYHNTLTMEIRCTPDENLHSELWETKNIPPFIVQPFVENAVRHGVRPLLQQALSSGASPYTAQITVSFVDEGTHLRCVVQDNGIGRVAAEEWKKRRGIGYANRNVDRKESRVLPRSPHLSVSTTITQERLQLLQEVHQLHLSVQIDDLLNDDGTPAGTRVTVLIPYC